MRSGPEPSASQTQVLFRLSIEFVRLREMLSTNRQVAAKLAELDRRLKGHDTVIQELIEAIQELMSPEPAKDGHIGFKLPGKSG